MPATLGELERRVEQLEKDNDLREELRGLERRIDELSQKVDARFDRTGERLKKIEDRLDEAGRKIDLVIEAVAAVNDQFQKGIGDIADGFAAGDVAFAKLAKAIMELTNVVAKK